MRTTGPGLLAHAESLRAERTPFVLATVVRAQRPTSARPGDRALVLADGTIEGFVGGRAPSRRCGCTACACSARGNRPCCGSPRSPAGSPL
ncbi:XdhC family protein [Prauserella oleivorans]